MKEPDRIFIRSLKTKELHNPSATRHMSKFPDKSGYHKVYMPYGIEGRGYYYIKIGNNSFHMV